MKEGDFYGSEQTATVAAASDVRIELVPAAGGAPVVLKASTKLEARRDDLQPLAIGLTLPLAVGATI